MTSNHPNPFAALPLPPGVALPGGNEILDWLVHGLQSCARLALLGARGMGKTSVLGAVSHSLQHTGQGVLFCVDVLAHSSIGSVAAEIQQFAQGLSAGGPVARGIPSPGRGLPGNTFPMEPGQSSTALFAALHHLGRVARLRSLPVAVAFDGFPALRRLGGALFEQGLRTTFQDQPGLGFILSGSEAEMMPLLNDAGHPLHGLVQGRVMEPVNPRQLADWIDGQFARAAFVSAGVGAACVEQGGPRTSDIVDLARRTYDLGAQARFANASTVETALGQCIEENQARYASTWKALKPEERSVLKSVARAPRISPTSVPPQNALPDPKPGARAAVESLRARGLIEKIGSAGFRLESPALKGWTLKADLNVTRERTESAASPTLRFNFDLRAGRAAPAASKGVSL